MDINQLKTILNVAELGSLTKAAEQLRIAQPALSRQVRLLEKELGAKLFDRHGRGMVVTEVGRDVLRHARNIMDEIDNIRSSAIDKEAPLTGQVSIGLPPTVDGILSVPLVRAIRKKHPDLSLRIISAYSGFLLDWLHRGVIDIAVLFEGKPAASLKSVPIMNENLYLIGAAHEKLKSDQPLSFASIANFEMLLPSSGHGLRNIIDDCARKCSIDLNVQMEADSYSTLIELVKAGQGMTILPLGPILKEIKARTLTYAPLADPMPARKLLPTTSLDRRETRPINYVGQSIIKTSQEMVADGTWPGKLDIV